MFSKDITSSDAFREMPASSQALYFHLGMEADDDGFLDNYKGLMRSINASEDDLRVLIGKRFLILFPSKIIVVKHWKINNTVQKDRYHETKHLDEKRALIVKENGSYTELSNKCIQSVSKMDTQYRIGEDRIVSEAELRVESYSEKEEEPRARSKPKYPHAKEVFAWFPSPEPSWLKNTTELTHAEFLYERGEADVKKALVYHNKHKDDENYGFTVVKPSDLERKWNNIKEYARKTK
jgi:hypothetical protein